jgi:hypothetical protein
MFWLCLLAGSVPMGLQSTKGDEERWWRELQLAASASAGGEFWHVLQRSGTLKKRIRCQLHGPFHAILAGVIAGDDLGEDSADGRHQHCRKESGHCYCDSRSQKRVLNHILALDVPPNSICSVTEIDHGTRPFFFYIAGTSLDKQAHFSRSDISRGIPDVLPPSKYYVELPLRLCYGFT